MKLSHYTNRQSTGEKSPFRGKYSHLDTVYQGPSRVNPKSEIDETCSRSQVRWCYWESQRLG